MNKIGGTREVQATFHIQGVAEFQAKATGPIEVLHVSRKLSPEVVQYLLLNPPFGPMEDFYFWTLQDQIYLYRLRKLLSMSKQCPLGSRIICSCRGKGAPPSCGADLRGKLPALRR